MIAVGVLVALLVIAAAVSAGGDDGAGDAVGVNSESPVLSPAASTPSTSASTSTSSSTSTSTTTTTVPPARLLLQINAEVQRACKEARLSNSSPEISFESIWTPVVDEQRMVDLAMACIEEANQAEIASAQTINVDEVTRNPDAVEGQVFVMVSEITQFDDATGTCAFRGHWDNETRESSSEYAGDDAAFSAGDGDTLCPVLTGIDQNDVVRLWVRGSGTLDSGDQIGGNTKVPIFYVLKAEVIEKR